MIGRARVIASIVALLGAPAVASAQPASDVARADALFKDAKKLAEAGRYAEACPKFSQSQRLASGIGVTMYLADCYERTGRTASAWAEFREAEKLAREHGDPRAGIAKARAESLDHKLSLEQADTLFLEASQLRDAGRMTEACEKFAASQKLVPAIGVTLHLADCYEKTGRTASAWTEFREAEQRAREKGDSRADGAHARARALEPKLSRLIVAVPPSEPETSEVLVDGTPLPREEWNVALAVDPVDHVVTLQVPGRTERVLTAHVQVDGAPLTVRFDPSDSDKTAPPTSAAPVVTTPVVAAATPSAPAAPAAPPELSKPDASSANGARRWAELGLLGATLVGVGVGAAFLVAKNDSMTDGGPNGAPHENDGYAAASAIGFAVGGAALTSALVLYLATPVAKDTALRIAPAPLVGGAGAFVTGRF